MKEVGIERVHKLFLFTFLGIILSNQAHAFMSPRPLWERDLDGIISAIDSSNNYTIIGAGDRVYLLGLNGSKIWDYKTSGNITAVAISEKESYVLVASRQLIYILDINGSLIRSFLYEGWVWDFDTSRPNKNVSNALYHYPEKGYFLGLGNVVGKGKNRFFTFVINIITNKPRLVGVDGSVSNYSDPCSASGIFLNRTSNWGHSISVWAGKEVGDLKLGWIESHCSWGNYTVVSTTNEEMHLVTLFDFSKRNNSVVWQLKNPERAEIVSFARNGSYIITASNDKLALYENPNAREPTPSIIVLANSIDYLLALDFFEFLKSRGMNVTHSTASGFERYKEEKFIVILGGPDAYDGVGEIVKDVLNVKEGDFLRKRGNRNMYVKHNLWTKGQVVIVIAGSGRNETAAAHKMYRYKILNKLLTEEDRLSTQ